MLNKELLAQPEECYCDRMGIGVPGVSCGDCPRDYKPAAPQPEPVAIADGTFNCSAPLGTPLYAQPISEVVVHANYREMWRETLADNQRLCAALLDGRQLLCIREGLPPLPPLPVTHPEECIVVNADDIRARDEEIVRVVLQAAANMCRDAESGLWKVYKQGDGALKKGRGSEYVQGAADQSALLADAVVNLEFHHE